MQFTCLPHWLQIIRALRYLHKQKHIVHRDLKPANIMLGENDKLTISMHDSLNYCAVLIIIVILVTVGM